MGSLLAALRAELEALEVGLAEDLRVRKAATILELLEMYGASPELPDRSGPLPERQSSPPFVVKQTLSFQRIRSVVRTIVRRGGTASVARARLVEMARNHWPSSSSAWLEQQANATAPSTRDSVVQTSLSKITGENAPKPKLAVT